MTASLMSCKTAKSLGKFQNRLLGSLTGFQVPVDPRLSKRTEMVRMTLTHSSLYSVATEVSPTTIVIT